MKLSIVDVSNVAPGDTRSDALANTIESAQLADKLGYERYWFAEHHGAPWVAGRAPEVMIAAVAAQTSRIRLGSGAVLLNHYSALKVAEVFCTLNELYPGRIDLGIGRATTGPVTDYALQQDRSKQFRANSDEQISEIISWLDNSFPDDHPFAENPLHTIDSIPEVSLLGSSAWSASAAAALGLRYVFAGFINQRGTPDIFANYCRDFVPSDRETGVKKPTPILSVHAVCADTEDEARRQLAPVHVMYANLARGDVKSPMLSPDDAVKKIGGPPKLERYKVGSGIPPKFIGGTFEQVQETFGQLAKDLAVDEIVIQDMMVDHEARLHSYEMLAKMISE